MSSRKLFEAIGNVDDKYLDMIDTSEMENFSMNKDIHMHFLSRRTISILIAAVICISLLTVTAVAAGWIPNIFASVKPSTSEDAAVLNAAVEATLPQQPETVTVPEIDFTQFTLFERYYDGKSILLGYDLSKVMPEPVVGFQPDEVLFEKITAMKEFEHTPFPGQTDDTLALSVSLGIMTQEECDFLLDSRTENGKKYDLQKYWQIYMDQHMQQILSPEQYEQFWKILTETGSCCVAVPAKPWIGDHIFVNEHDCFEVIGPDCGSYRRDYSTDQGDCILLAPLPEAGKNQGSVTVKLELRSGWDYWYMELEGDVYSAFEPNPVHQADFVIENVNK